MTDIKVSDCCGSALVPAGDGFTCRKCEGACGAIWEVIIWDEGKVSNAETVKCMLCGHSFPQVQMRRMATSADWICKDYTERLDRQKEKG